MEILDLITRILYIIAVVVVVVGPMTAMAVTCHQVTRTWNVRRFYGDRRYWAMSILNFRYREKKACPVVSLSVSSIAITWLKAFGECGEN